MQDDRSSSIFETRAEHLTRRQLESWTALSAREKKVVAKLKGTGAKLLTGPRGSGKSTLMRLAYFQLIDSGDALPVYVNYAKHLAIEPIFKSRPDATDMFRQWVIAKVILGLHETESDISPSQSHKRPNNRVHVDRHDLLKSSRELIEKLEVGVVPDNLIRVSPTQLIAYINEFTAAAARKRAVLLFDDAAHAFSAPQQREFFEIFRQLRTRTVAPKAAVYPGVTNYSANMHIGHDAEVLEAWYRADDPAYLETMQEVLARRLPAEMKEEFEGDRVELLNYLALASFGMPRSLLTMIQEVLEYDEDEGTHVAPTRRRADSAIERNVSIVRAVFESTGEKIPRYSNLITEGRRLEDALLKALLKFNSNKRVGQKTVTIGVRRPLTKEFQQVIDLMAYAGIVRGLDSQSRGSTYVYERYELHAGFVISTNALTLGRNPAAREIVTSLLKRPPAALVRGSAEQFLGEGYRSRCTLNLTPCSNCGAPRVSEDAQFCMRCGKPLTDKSLYHEILQRPLADLPIVGLLNVCPLSRAHAGAQMVPFGSIHYYGQAEVAYGLFDSASLAGGEEIRKTVRKLTGIELAQNGPSADGIIKFDQLCHLRHAAVHAHGSIGTGNASALGIASVGGRLSLDVNLARLHESAMICRSLAQEINQILFMKTFARWRDAGLLSRSYSTDRDTFTRLYSLFRSKKDVDSRKLQPKAAYDRLIK